jgi:hypothetical protein
MRIIIGAVKGISRIHAENGGKFDHGNINPQTSFLILSSIVVYLILV